MNKDTTIAGTAVAAGTRLMPLWGSANRDERQFERPEQVDVHRANLNMHLGFGFGLHFCLGASLARLEAKTALEALVPELPRLRRRDDTIQYVDSFLVRGPARLDLVAA